MIKLFVTNVNCEERWVNKKQKFEQKNVACFNKTVIFRKQKKKELEVSEVLETDDSGE